MSLAEWIEVRLSELLDFPVPTDLTEYIIAIENARDLEEYLKNLLNFNDPKHRQFYKELLHRRASVLTSSSADVQRYKKSEVEEVYFQPRQNEKKKKSKGPSSETNNVQKEPLKVQGQEEKKKKAKFVNLYSQEGQMKDNIMLRGRHHCECQATKHKLIANCLQCGRIVCEQEGSGPCFFCENMVCTREERKILSGSSKQREELYEKLMSREKIGLDAAIQQRNKLLEFDQTSEKRTKVIDDESDYYSTNSVWLSQNEREKLMKLEEQHHAKRHGSRLNKEYTLDFAGRQVLEEYNEPEVLDAMYSLHENDGNAANLNLSSSDSDAWKDSLHPRTMCERPIFQEQSKPKLYQEGKQGNHKTALTFSRVQDKEYLEMSDDGACLSMHQPWASLLVAGIKQHEGRVWYHSHRGRLWIAATAKPPVMEEVKQVEHMYKVLKIDPIKFPSLYPTGCLLGCVSVVDCLPQEEYRSRYPEGESDSPFVFICEDAKELPIKFPIQGKHKIYKLDKKIHEAAAKSLERIARVRAKQARDKDFD